MRTTVRAAVLVAGLMLLSGCASGGKTGAGESGFVTLFNGKDTTGWIYGSKAGEGYQVENGVLYCTAKDGGNLFTEKEYADFVFRFEFRLTPNGNNGVGIRAPLKGDAAYVGMEIQILDDSGSAYQALRPEQYHGSIYDLFPARRGSLKPVGEWNTEEIIAKGRRITVKVNGQTIVDANLDDIKDPAKLAKHPGINNPRGHIGFLGHGSRIEFRNIRVKEL